MILEGFKPIICQIMIDDGDNSLIGIDLTLYYVPMLMMGAVIYTMLVLKVDEMAVI